MNASTIAVRFLCSTTLLALGSTASATDSTVQSGSNVASTPQAIDGSALTAIDGSALHAIDGSAIRAVERAANGSVVLAIDGSAIQAIDGSAIHAIDGSAIQAIDGSAIQAIDGSALHGIDNAALHAIDGSAILSTGRKNLLGNQSLSLSSIDTIEVDGSGIVTRVGGKRNLRFGIENRIHGGHVTDNSLSRPTEVTLNGQNIDVVTPTVGPRQITNSLSAAPNYVEGRVAPTSQPRTRNLQ